jgi:hypothetical protein
MLRNPAAGVAHFLIQGRLKEGVNGSVFQRSSASMHLFKEVEK